jgi:hypothetical protein
MRAILTSGRRSGLNERTMIAMAYPTVHHAACGVLVNRNEAPSTRQAVARAVRHYRKLGDRRMVRHCREHFAHVG